MPLSCVAGLTCPDWRIIAGTRKAPSQFGVFSLR